MKRKSLKLFMGILLGLFIQSVGWAAENSSEPLGNTLTYGMVKKNIKIGQSTQEDVVKLFGSPDNMVMRKTKEIWVYDRYRVETDTSTSSGYGTILL